MDKSITLKHKSTFAMGGEAKEFLVVTAKEQIPEVLKRTAKDCPIWILGAGSNTIFTDNFLQRTILKMQIMGVTRLPSSISNVVRYYAAAGEDWDAFVSKVTQQGLYGLELLSGIPGTVGAAPVQNIGAYGAELADVIEQVECYDTQNKAFCKLSKDVCKFAYRSSIFKTSARGRYIITGIVVFLSTRPIRLTIHTEVVAKLSHQHPTPQAVRRAVLDIRARKLVNYLEVPNVGSFFQNPIITFLEAEKLKQQFPTIPLFRQTSNCYKASAAWLLQTAGFRGKVFGHFQFSPKHALVLTHLGGGTMQELLELVSYVTATIQAQFGVMLQVEPEIVK